MIITIIEYKCNILQEVTCLILMCESERVMSNPFVNVHCVPKEFTVTTMACDDNSLVGKNGVKYICSELFTELNNL